MKHREDVPPEIQTTLQKLQREIWPTLKGRSGPDNKYEIKYDEGTRTAIIEKTSQEVFTRGSYIRDAYADFVKYGYLSFGVDWVKNISVQYKLRMSDFYGKESFNDSIIITMSKEDFVKFNCKSLNYQPIDQQLELTCSKYYIHPVLLKGVKKEDLWLTD